MAKSIDTAAVKATSTMISSLNEQLDAALRRSQASVQSLSGKWTGQAANATIAVYEGFVSAGIAKSKDKLGNYVDFLNRFAGEGYEETERVNVSKADQI